MDKELLELRGIITVFNTPFTEDDGIDTQGLRRNVSRAIDAGVAGFLVPAMASEVGKLSEAERRLLVESVVDEAAGRVPVIGGASAPDCEQRVRIAGDLIAMGCQGVLVSIPYESDAQYETDVRAIDELRPPFLMLQDWDANGYGVPVSTVARLFREVESFRCLKVEVVPAGRKYSQVIEATEGKLHVSGGWAVMQMIDALDRGVHAFMPTGLHEIYTAIHRQYCAGHRRNAQRIFNLVLPVLAFSNQHLDISIHFFKRLLHAEGYYATSRVREPILPFDAHHERIANELIGRAVHLTRSLDTILASSARQ